MFLKIVTNQCLKGLFYNENKTQFDNLENNLKLILKIDFFKTVEKLKRQNT